MFYEDIFSLRKISCECTAKSVTQINFSAFKTFLSFMTGDHKLYIPTFDRRILFRNNGIKESQI